MKNYSTSSEYDESLENWAWEFLENFPEFREHIFPGQKKYIQACTNYLCESWYYENFLAKNILKVENPTQDQIEQLIAEKLITNEKLRKEIIRQSHSLSVWYRLAKTLFASKGFQEKDFENYSKLVFEACFELAEKYNISLWPSILNFALLSPLDWDAKNIDLYRVFNEYFATLWQSKDFDLNNRLEFDMLIKILDQKTKWRKWVRSEDLSCKFQTKCFVCSFFLG